MEMLEVLSNQSVRIIKKKYHEETYVESPKKSLLRISEMRLTTLKPKGTKSDHDGSCHIMVNGQMIFGLQVASKVFTIICDVKLGKPYALHKLVETLQRVTMEQRVEERVKSE